MADKKNKTAQELEADDTVYSMRPPTARMRLLVADVFRSILDEYMDAITKRTVKKLYTPEEAADYLAISHKTLAKWRQQTNKGPDFIILPSGEAETKNGKHSLIRYTKEELDAWVDKQRKYKSSAQAEMTALKLKPTKRSA
jgi:hypothetical protein